MRFIILLLTGIAMLITVTAASAATPEPVSGNLVRLPNGLPVLIKKDTRFPLVSLRLYVRTGSTYEDPKDAGISHLLEHMVFKGTESRPKGSVAAEIEKTGGYLNAATSFDYTVYLTDMPEESWKTGLDVLKDMPFHATIDPAELESEKGVVLAELKRGEDSPMGKLFRLTLKRALNGTPYQTPIIGYEDTIKAATRESIKAYIATHYQPQNMLLLICGNVDEKDALLEAEKLFGDLKNTTQMTDVTPFPDSAAMPDPAPVVETGPWSKVHLAVSIPVPGQDDVRAPGLDVLAHILGGDTTSRFYRKYKYERQEVDAISVSNYSFARQGLFLITVVLDADKVAPFWNELTKDMASLGKVSFSAQEIGRAKLNIEDSLFRSKETLAGLTSKLGYFQLFGKGEYSEENYLQALAGTDASNLTELAAGTFVPSRAATVCLTPENMPVPQGAASLQAFLQSALDANWPIASKTVTQKEDVADTAGQAEVVDLGNNRTLVLLPDNTLPYAAVNMVFSGGDSLLSKKEQGLGAFSASLLAKGTAKLDAPALEEFLSDRAAEFGASSGRQTFTLAFDAPSKFMDDMFGVLADTISGPAMLETEAERVRQNQIAAIVSAEDQPTGLVFRRLFPFLFQNHSYGFLQLGEKDGVSKMSAKDAVAFWDKQRRQPWTMAVCGTFDREHVISLAKQLPVPDAKRVAVGAPQWGKEKTLSLNLPKREQAHLLMVFPTVGMGHPDEAALDLLQNILAGQSGLLFSDLRDEQGLGYTVTAVPWRAPESGALIFYIGTDPVKIDQAKAGFASVIKRLHETTVSAEDLERGKQQMVGDYYRSHQKLGSRSSEAALLQTLGRPLDEEKQNIEKARHVTAEELQKIAVRYLVPAKAYTAVVMP